MKGLVALARPTAFFDGFASTVFVERVQRGPAMPRGVAGPRLVCAEVCARGLRLYVESVESS